MKSGMVARSGMIIWLTAFICLICLICPFKTLGEAGQGRAQTGGQKPLTLTFYTSQAATCPQLPLFSALDKGLLDSICSLDIKLWKNQDDLRGVLLAGRGSLWLGSMETFGRAAHLGAPLTVLVISGWRKYHLVSRDPAVTGFGDFEGKRLYFGPVAAPVGALLKGLEKHGGPKLSLLGLENHQLSLMLLQGRVDSAVLPEPLVTVLLQKDHRLRAVTGVAELVGKLTGGPERIPWAGLAIHQDVIRDHPEMIERLVDILVKEGRALALDPEMGISSLPDEFETTVGNDLIRRSLRRDLILVERAAEVEMEVLNHLRLVAPDLFEQADHDFPPSTFFFRRP